MAVIVSTPLSVQPGITTITETTMTAADTLTYVPGSGQVLKIRNPSVASITVIVLGTSPTSPVVAGTGVTFSTAAGKSISVAVGATVAINLDKISAYLQGTLSAVGVTGGTGGFASLIA